MVPIYVINLDRDIARLQFVRALFSRHGLSFERIPAVDGRRLWELSGPEIVPVRPSPLFPRGLMMKDQGLTMSHRKAAMRMLASGGHVGCVMEDDVDFGPSFRRLLSLLTVTPPADIVKLEGIGTKRHVLPVATIENHVLAATAKPIMGAAAYLMTRRGAQSIVNLTETVREPFDHVLAHLTGRASLLNVFPYPVRQRPEAVVIPNDFETIKAKPVSPIKRIERELHRNRRYAWAAIDLVRRYPTRMFRWRRVALQENGGRGNRGGWREQSESGYESPRIHTTKPKPLV
jgi:glycosyl transferase, family 25